MMPEKQNDLPPTSDPALASASGSDVPVCLMTLRDMLAAGATEKDVDGILHENIQAYITGNKIHDRQTARWQHADRMMKHRQNDQALPQGGAKKGNDEH